MKYTALILILFTFSKSHATVKPGSTQIGTVENGEMTLSMDADELAETWSSAMEKLNIWAIVKNVHLDKIKDGESTIYVLRADDGFGFWKYAIALVEVDGKLFESLDEGKSTLVVAESKEADCLPQCDSSRTWKLDCCNSEEKDCELTVKESTSPVFQ